jgi:uncharacterized membrane protein YraQ (UPF0718 family)
MALAVIWVSLVVGVVLGLWQRVATRTTGPIRTFAVVAAGLVVALSLLPHAIASEGLAGLAVAAGSVALVPVLERLVRVPFRNVDAEGLRLELGFAGLLVHRFGDGVVMAVDGHGNELSWAVGAHEIPIVALVTLAYARRGLTTAFIRAALLGLASSFGYWVVRSMPGTWHDLHGWVDAIAAGILVHILAYEALPESLETRRERAFDVLGALLGLLIVLLPSFEEHEHVPNVARSLLRGSLSAAPLLMLGLAGSALLLSRTRRRSNDAPARVGMARPWPGVEAFTLALGSLGWLAACCYTFAAGSLGALATILVRSSTPPAASSPHADEPGAEPALPLWATLEALMLRVGGWLGLGLLGQSYIESFVPGPELLASLDLPARALLAVVVAIPASVCTAGAVPLAAALVGKGLSPAIALAGLVLGPLLSNVVNLLQRAGVSLLRAAFAAAPLGLGVLALALWLPGLLPRGRVADVGSAGLIEWAAFAALGLILAKSIWRVGVRAWLGSSLRSLGPTTRRQHAHAH